MTETVLAWPVQSLTQALQTVLPELQVQVVPQTGSTNSVLMQRLRAGAMTPTLLVAELQSAGRGRLGRRWQQGPAGAALAFSLALPLAPRDWSGLSLAVGVAVAENLHPDIQLKWPNDLWWHGRKLGGILIETTTNAALDSQARPTLRWAVVGVGINVALPPLPGSFATPAAALQDVSGVITAPEVLQCVALPLLRAIKRFEQNGFASFAPAFARCDALCGRAVRLSDDTEGVADGVDESGALRLQTSTGLQLVRSLEVSVRPSGVDAGRQRSAVP